MLSGNCKTSQVCNQYLDFSPFFQTPAVSPRSRSNERFLLAATIMRVSPTALLGLTTLNHFKLSPYGSKSFLPTLNTHLTDLCPRLDTDSLLRFIGSGVSPDYIDCTELAHHNVPSFRDPISEDILCGRPLTALQAVSYEMYLDLSRFFPHVIIG